MKISSFFLLLAALAFLPVAHAGDITGVITLKGTPPAAVEITPIKDDPNCSLSYPGALPKTKFYVVDANGDLADVIVTLKGISAPSTGASAPSVLLDQKGCLYNPQILAVQTGQKIIVRNSDNCVHNIHTVPKANDPRNVVQMPGGADLTFVFDKPEPFLKFQCDVHPWMFAWVTVVDNPYYAVSGADGKFTIKNVPPGKYTLEAAHRKLGTQTAEVEVKADGAAQNFTFEVK
ncbi:MAG TPA: carboxypeptidase regulatory-like domain-containing protein [Verrucomicrobiae bacterium]